MKLATPLYEGDSIIRRGPEPARTTGSERDLTLKIVRCNAPSVREISARADVERGATVARYLGRFWRWLAVQLDGARRSHEEAFLAQAQSLSEVERRIRELERASLMRI